MKRVSSFVFCVAVLFVFVSVRASATLITVTLNCDIIGPKCTSARSGGTLEFADSATDSNRRDVTLPVSSGDPHHSDFTVSRLHTPRVPESASLLLFGAGLGLIGYRIRKRKRRRT